MINQQDERLIIGSYLERQSRLERAEAARAEADAARKARALISLRLRELGWTTSRAMRKLFPGLVNPSNSTSPPWPIARPRWEGPAPAPSGVPRVLIDVTDTARRNQGTGVQRVVMEIAEARACR